MSSEGQVVVIELPDRTLSVAPGPAKGSLTDLFRLAEYPLNTRCGQRGICDGCTVELLEGELVESATGAIVRAGEVPVVVKACTHGAGNSSRIRIHVPARSILRHTPQIVKNFRLNVPVGSDPIVSHVTSGDVGAAIDVGTTTVVVTVVDLVTGKVAGASASLNRQIAHGDDVVTRINLCCASPDAVQTLHHAIIDETIIPLLRHALKLAHTSAKKLRCVTVAGNTTMLHLVAGADPAPMGTYPFEPQFLEHKQLDAKLLAALGCAAEIHLLPSCSAYVGADVLAGTVATGMMYEPGPCLLVDIGTNGEIVLKHGDKMLACATAAGPAFEGAGLSCGMRASKGAISRVRLSGSPPTVKTRVIGSREGRSAVGICGSAYVDFIAEGRRGGVLGYAGRFEETMLGGLEVLNTNGHGKSLVLSRDESGRAVIVSEADVSKLLQAKAAIAAGIDTLLRRADLTAGQIQKLYLAGGFGLHINVPNAIRCGLLPGFTAGQIEVVGNTSLGGAYLAMLDRSVLNDLQRAAGAMTTVELNHDPEFEMSYIDHLTLV